MGSSLKAKRLNEVDIIRTSAILLVVLAHCIGPYIDTLPSSGVIFERNYGFKVFTRFLQAFRMPAIVLMAGYVFNFMSQRNTESLKKLIFSKFRRLIIPSLVFSLAWILLFAKDVNEIKKIHMLLSGAEHLWFLPMLFWNFIVGYMLLKINVQRPRYKILLFLFLFIISFLSPWLFPNIFGISRALSFTVFFYIGIQLYEYRENIIEHLKPKLLFYTFVIFTFIFILNEFALLKMAPLKLERIFGRYNLFTGYRLFVRHVLGLWGVLCFFITVLYFTEYKKLVVNRAFRNLSKKTYGIYVFHYFILHFLIYDFKLYKIIDYSLAPFITFIFLIFSSLLLTNIFLKFKIGKYLIG